MKNKLKQLLADGIPAIGSWIGFTDPYCVEMMANIGFDWLLIDTEHMPIDREGLRTVLMACKGSGSVPVVRLPSGSREHIQTALDLGAQGVMLPMIGSAAEVNHALQLCRYPPFGNRGFGPIRASRYLEEAAEYRAEANEEAAFFVQIETPAGVENASEIICSPGIDGVFIGNGDLASFMNGDGMVHAQNVEQTVNGLIRMASSSSVPVGLPTWSAEECRKYAQQGAHLLTIGADITFLSTHAKAGLLAARRALEMPESERNQPA